MPTLDQIKREEYMEALAGSIHLLLIGHTKMGKTDYVAQAANDGFTVIYIGRDNGLATLLTTTTPEAQKRIHYFEPENFAQFVDQFLTLPIIRYNLRTKSAPNFNDKPDDRIVEIYPAKIPKNVILSLDGWSALSMSILSNKADKLDIDLSDVDKFSREIYGGSGFQATQLADGIQKLPFHVIVQAHPAVYERKEKPEGRQMSAITERDMIIMGTTEIPMSVSMPHGATLGKFFNQIGWLTINRANQRQLDFRVIQGRVGGGTPNNIGDPRTGFRFSKLFGTPGEYPPESQWIQEMSVEEMKLKAQNTGIKLGGPKPAAPAGNASPPAATGGLKIGGLKIVSTQQGKTDDSTGTDAPTEAES